MDNVLAGTSTDGIQRMFKKYVAESGQKPRHTKTADNEVGFFCAFLSGAFSGNIKLQNALYNRMMSCAVEFEESGFIAGFQCAINLVSGRDQPFHAEATPIPQATGTTFQETTQHPQELEQATTKQPIGPFAPKESEETLIGSITSKQIAEMFKTSNAKVVSRIEKRILPFVDAQSRSNFAREVYYTPQGRKASFYRLNKAACDIYIKVIEPYRTHVNIVGGLAKMEELMKTVFPK